MKVVHESLHTSLIDNGYDPNRPLPGVCIRFTSPATLDDNLQYNLSFSDRKFAALPTTSFKLLVCELALQIYRAGSWF